MIIDPRESDFLFAHNNGVTALCPNPHLDARFCKLAQQGPEDLPEVWVFTHPTILAGKGGKPVIHRGSDLFHDTIDGWRRLYQHWTGLWLTFSEDPRLHVPFSGGRRAKPREVELALRRNDAPAMAIATWEQIVRPPVIVEYKSGKNTVTLETHEHGVAWVAAHVARTKGVFRSPLHDTTHEVLQVREPRAGDWSVVIRVRNKPMKQGA